MGKITYRGRTFLILFFLLGSSLTFLTATNKKSADITISGTISHVSCFGGSNGSIATTISGGSGSYTITWSGSNQTTKDISELSTGSYTITVQDDTHSESKEFIVNQPSALGATAPTSSDVTCNGLSDGSITAGIVTGGTAPYLYSLNNIDFDTNSTFPGLTARDYIIYIKDTNGCNIQQSVTVTEPDVLTMAQPISIPVSCNGGNDGTATAGTVTGGNGGYQYKLDTGIYGTSNSFNELTAGTYTITVKDSENCETSQSVTVTQPDALTLAAPTSTPVSCNEGNDGTATAGAVSGGNGGYQYKLDAGTYGTLNTFGGLTAGTYTITVKDSKGCETSQSVTVTQPDALTLATSSTTLVSCNGGNDGAATAGTVSGGNGGYQYKLDSGTFGTSNSFSSLTAGTYMITVKDSKGCETTQSVTVTQPDAIAMTTPTSTPVSCNGGNDGTATAGTVSGGNGGNLYKLDTGTYGTSNTFSSLTAGTYTITVKDSKDCETSQSVTITQQDAITMATPTSTPVSCNGGNDGTATAGTVSGGNGGYQYKINAGTYGTSNSFSGLTAGTHTITVKDSKGCETSQPVTVTQPDPLVMAESTSTPVSCNGGNDGSVTAGAVTGGNGGYQYKLNSSTYGTSNTFSGLVVGTYIITVQDSKGCETSQSVTVGQPDALSMATPSSTPVSCNGGNDGTVTAGAVSGGNGGYQYSLDNITFITGTIFTGIPAGTHTIFIKDSKGCSLQKTVTVTEPNVLNATVTKTDISCFGGNDGTITLSGSSGGSGTYEYRVNNDTWQSSNTISGLISETYNLQIRDTNVPDCVIVLNENLQLNQPAAVLAVEVSTTRTTTYGTATGSATANPTGGTPGYTYQWRKKNGTAILHTTKTVNNFEAGNYTLVVIDSKGCRDEKDFTIIDALEAFIVSRSICESVEGDTDMRTSYFEVENLTAFGGVSPYEYSWNFGADAANPLRTGVGEHQVFFSEIGNKTVTLTVTDFTGKELTLTQSLYVGKCYEPCGKSENIVFDPNNFYVGDSNGTAIDLQNNCTDDQAKYIYLKVDKSANTYNPYVELVYIVRNGIDEIIDTNFIKGCRDGDDIDDDPTDNKDNKIGEYIRFTIDPIEFKCGDNLDIDNFYITWTNVSKKDCGQNNNAFCYSIDDPLVLPTALVAEATATEILCKGDASGIINVKVSGGFAPYTFSLTEDNPDYQTNSQFINNEAGDYIIHIKDARGNTTTASASIIEPSYAISAEVIPTPPICFGETGEATVTATGGTPFTIEEAYEYLWNDANQQTTATATGLIAGNYTVTVIDANGCQILREVTITEPEQLSLAGAGDDQSFSCGFNSTFLEANAPVTGTGTWSIISGTGGTIANLNDPNSAFTGSPGIFNLQWTIAHPDGSCSTIDDVQITFVEDCSTLDFDGIDDHIVFGDNYGLSSGTFSMEAWVKLKSTNGEKTILSKRNMRNPGEGGYDLVINQGAPTFRWGNSSVSSSSQMGTQRWYHIAVIFKDSRANLYVDGIRVGNAAATNPVVTSFPFLIGAEYDEDNPENPQNYFHGWIEEVRLWNSALTEEQLRFMMNQRLEVGVTPIKGEVLPLSVPGNLNWVSLGGYYQLLVSEAANGITKDKSANKVDGLLKNITTPQENTAPLPYISVANGPWRDKNVWAQPVVWDVPNSKGINDANINWNIAKINHDITSGGYDINVLGLLSEGGTLIVSDPDHTQDWQNPGQGLRVSHYLNLDGNIILVGESQLVQTDIKTAAEITDPTVEFPQSITSVLDESSSGYIERAQQGTENSYNYNYWSSPVSLQGAANNSTYTVKGVMLDGSATTNYGKILDFNDWHEWADYSYAASADRRVSNYWINKFRGTSNVYSEWKRIGSTGILLAGEGYTMKGTSGDAAISDPQNYVFKGKPNNGTITLEIGKDQNYLLGNPYPSSINANKFILDNLNAADVSGATNTKNVFNGALYFWDHFAGKSHILLEYVGGYATRNLTGGVPAASTDERINSNDAKGTKVPGQFIPVAQGFFINTVLDPEFSGDYTVEEVIFKNSQRAFVTERNSSDSQFLRPENPSKENKQADTRSKIRLDFRSPLGYHRQILVGVDPNASDGFDLGYDAALNDNNLEDMFWLIDNNRYVIQGVSNFDLTQVLKLGVRIEEEGEVLIKINDLENITEDVNIYLKDNADSTYHDLKKSDYKLNLEKGEINERFEIVFQKEKDPEPDPEPIEETHTDLPETLPPGIIDVIFAKNQHKLMVLNPFEMNIEQVEIYNMLGQRVESFTSNSNQKEMIVPVREHPAAIYVVKVYAVEGMVSKNILLMR